MLIRNVGVALLISVAAPKALHAADCNISFPQMVFCKRCTTVVPASTTRDVACNGYSPGGPGSPQAAMVGTNIAQRPKNGTLKLEGRGWVYTPRKGFVGQDTFKIERDMIKDNELFVLYIQFNMEVKP